MIVEGDQRSLAGDVDDAAGELRLDHFCRDPAGDLGGGTGVYVHHLIEGGGADRGGGFKPGNTGAVDQAVQWRQVMQGVVEGGAVGDVHAHRVAAQPGQGLGVAAEGETSAPLLMS